jgi:hypothetical protein
MYPVCTNGPPNKPLERPGVNAVRPTEPASAGRSAPSRSPHWRAENVIN